MNRRKLNVLISVSMLAIVSLAADAAPNISGANGSLAHGGTVQLSGSGFGTRGNYNNVNAEWKGHDFLAFRVKDFDDGNLSGDGFRDTNSSWVLRNGGRRNGGHFASKFYNGQRLGALETNQSGTTGTWYISYWFMMPPDTSSSKPFRLYGSGEARNLYLASGGQGSGEGFNIRGYSECTASECSSETVWSSPDKFTANKWHRVEIEMSQSNSGSIKVLLDGKHQWTRERWLATSSGIYNGHTIDLGSMINAAASGRNSPEDNSYNFDDVYFDFTLARVELANAPTWSAATYREVQIPISWSAGQIQFAVNQGQFNPGSTAYLYVVAADGSRNSQGYPVTMGGDVNSGDPGGDEEVKPNPPENLRAE